MFKRLTYITAALGGLGLLAVSSALAGDAHTLEKTAEVAAGNRYAIDTVWLLVAAYLVFFMQPGFAMVEAGLTRSKNAVNILAKNFADFSLASIMFFLVGYAFMYGDSIGGFIGFSNFALSGAEPTTEWMKLEGGEYAIWADWFFQAVFCGTAATIVSGGMAERTKFSAYLIATFFLSALIYPIVGHWKWGGGWLDALGFFDFAGSAIVHATGGMAALVGTMMLKPRIGKYGPDGKPRALPGHSLPLAALGVFILWFGWFGFNPGSQLAASGLANAEAIALITANTTLAAAAGAISAMMLVWGLYGKPDLSMCMNGALGGLVAITAPCAVVSPLASLVIGGLAGGVIVIGVRVLDALKIDDPVGAIPVHGFNGIWGTLAVGIWGQKALGLANDGLMHGGGVTQLGIQALGAFAIVAFVMVTMAIVFTIVKVTVGLRVEKDDELRGLDIVEHGMEAYADFQSFTTR